MVVSILSLGASYLFSRRELMCHVVGPVLTVRP